MRRLPSRLEIGQLSPDVLPRSVFRGHVIITRRRRSSLSMLLSPRIQWAPVACDRQRCYLAVAFCLVVTFSLLFNCAAFVFLQRHRVTKIKHQACCLQQGIYREAQHQVQSLRHNHALDVNVLPQISASQSQHRHSAIYMMRSTTPLNKTTQHGDIIGWSFSDHLFTNSDIEYSNKDGMFTINTAGVYLIYSKCSFNAHEPKKSLVFEQEIHQDGHTGHLLRQVTNASCDKSVETGVPSHNSLIASTLRLYAHSRIYVTVEPSEALGSTDYDFFGLIRLF